MDSQLLAVVYTVLMLIVMLFQLALALGAPWGAASMGGKYPGKYPQRMKMVAVANIFLLGFLIVIVLSKVGLILPSLSVFSRYAIWLVVGFSALGVFLNSITRSKIERIWIPVTLVQLYCSLVLALN